MNVDWSLTINVAIWIGGIKTRIVVLHEWIEYSLYAHFLGLLALCWYLSSLVSAHGFEIGLAPAPWIIFNPSI